VTEREAALATAPPHMQQHLDALRDELSRWLEQELPNAVLKVTDGLADQLMGELTDQAEKKLLPRLISRLDGTAHLGRWYPVGTNPQTGRCMSFLYRAARLGYCSLPVDIAKPEADVAQRAADRDIGQRQGCCHDTTPALPTRRTSPFKA
jgi:hypothetical protein